MHHRGRIVNPFNSEVVIFFRMQIQLSISEFKWECDDLIEDHLQVKMAQDMMDLAMMVRCTEVQDMMARCMGALDMMDLCTVVRDMMAQCMADPCMVSQCITIHNLDQCMVDRCKDDIICLPIV